MVDAYDGMLPYMYVDMGLKLVLAAMLLTAGIGLLKKRAWSIKLSVFWAVSRIIVAVGMLVWGLQVTAAFQDKLVPNQNQGQEQIQQISQGVGNVFGIIVLLVYPVVSLIFLTKKNVRDAMH